MSAETAQGSEGSMIVLDIRLVGCEYEEADVDAVRREFASIETLRVTGASSTGAGAGLEVTTVVYFVGVTFAAFVLEKTFDAAWERFRGAWTRFRDDRRGRQRSDPTFGAIAIRTDDMEVEIRRLDGDIEPPDLSRLLEVVADRLKNGSLRDVSVDSIRIPPPRWAEAPRDRAGDSLLWYVATRSLEGHWGLYDAGEDRWLD
jgi:hypothetical protein